MKRISEKHAESIRSIRQAAVKTAKAITKVILFAYFLSEELIKTVLYHLFRFETRADRAERITQMQSLLDQQHRPQAVEPTAA